ncbi:MAG: L-threonylcarbamoyladenylate synthase [Candidatus Pacearchaeota archaeon]|nr:L-threonylcarbamoyladenylate synthase [Candidatus Pacearchaeota archaeon]
MQKTISKNDFLKENYIEQVKQGAVFIYPTDTVYGIGCDATNKKAVARIRNIKGRLNKPFSVIAPSKTWISKNCFIDKKDKTFLEKLPGKYTLILKLRDKGAIAKNVIFGETLGVRIPKHWFAKIVKKSRVPIITTSVNLSGEKFMTSLEDLNKSILKKIDFIIYEGKKDKKPSKIIKLINRPEIIKR